MTHTHISKEMLQYKKSSMWSNVRSVVYACCLLLLIGSCSKGDSSQSGSKPNKPSKPKVVAPYIGDYKNQFDDLVDAHMEAAKSKGITPLETRADTSKYVGKKEAKLVRIPLEVELFKVDKLNNSIPYLVPDAAQLLVDISKGFRDSLSHKKLAIYRLIVTSVTRTEEDVKSLMKKNRNAVPESAHSYGTTFDISWKRYDKVDSTDTRNVPTDKLKYILGQVLYTLKNQDRCYVKHERRQACFHITVR